jgi:hypothetical protein
MLTEQRHLRRIIVIMPLMLIGYFMPLALNIVPQTVIRATNLCSEWNLVTDIRVDPNQENPNGDNCGNSDVWYFMSSSSLIRDPQTYTLTAHFVSNQFGIVGLQSWQGTHADSYWTNTRYPYVSVNTTGVTQNIGPETWLPQTIHVHPYLTELLIIGWRSPVSGTIAITGYISDASPCNSSSRTDDGVRWYIDKDTTNIASGDLNNGGSQLFRDGTGGTALIDIQVTGGQFIYFAIDPKTDYYCDATTLDIAIRPTTHVYLPMISKVTSGYRDAIIGRARLWVDAQVPYNQNGQRDGYRTDCSGFVSYAWQLKNNGQPISPDTVMLGATYSVDTSFSALLPGDIINNKRPGNSGHVVMFISWIDQAHTKFVAYEENGGYGKAVETALTLENVGSGFTIKEYNSAAPGPYFAQTYKAAP